MIATSVPFQLLLQAVRIINESQNQKLIDIRKQIKDSYENTKKIHEQHIEALKDYYQKVRENTYQPTIKEFIQDIEDEKIFRKHGKNEIVNGLKLQINIRKKETDLLQEFYNSIKKYLENYSINVGEQNKLNNNKNIESYINSFKNQGILESVNKLVRYSIIEEKGTLNSSIVIDLAKIAFKSLFNKNKKPHNQNIKNKEEIKFLILKIIEDLEESFIDVRKNYNALEKEISGHWLYVIIRQNPIKVSALLLILVLTMVLAKPKLIYYIGTPKIKRNSTSMFCEVTANW
ncbi:hypothetical protein LC653_37390 [Nostoc sp. CHAB 5784]|uniref:hypothetical protein n=1 Tax=Nostoc mirabile TaxID=2907820 RepID=UPI001E44C855|nr:hypothetical protein [Nostoc mirabile]MCC5669360.1 hypothetical protein [Nostoc mirabile CHAB5784]